MRVFQISNPGYTGYSHSDAIPEPGYAPEMPPFIGPTPVAGYRKIGNIAVRLCPATLPSRRTQPGSENLPPSREHPYPSLKPPVGEQQKIFVDD